MYTIFLHSSFCFCVCDSRDNHTYPEEYDFVHNIVLIRHGQANKMYFEQPLTELGRFQASFTGKRLKYLNVKFDLFETSELKRAVQTGEIISKYLNGSVVSTQDRILNEGAIALPALFGSQSIFAVSGSREGNVQI